MGHRFIGLRTQSARLAAAACRLNAARKDAGKPPPFTLAFFTDRRRAPEPEPILRALPRGTGVVYRDYDDPRRPALARRYAAIAKARGLIFLVAGDPALAQAVGADGVHLPAFIAARTDNKSLIDAYCSVNVLSMACHNETEIARANAFGADIVFISPVFATQSHPGAPPLADDRLAKLIAAAHAPALALGGVTADNAGMLRKAGFAGFAAISAFAQKS